MRNRATKGAKAQSLVETVAGLCILVPVLLALLDIGVVMIAGTIANNLAKQAARAAANVVQTNSTAANNAVQEVQKRFPPSSMFPKATLTLQGYDASKPPTNYGYGSNITVIADVTVNLPVPIPMLNVGPTVDIKTQSTEPVLMSTQGITPAAP